MLLMRHVPLVFEQVNVLQGTARRKQVDAALSSARRVSTLRPYADVLQDELTRREAALAAAHADNARLQTAVRQQLASKRTLNAELQVHTVHTHAVQAHHRQPAPQELCNIITCEALSRDTRSFTCMGWHLKRDKDCDAGQKREARFAGCFGITPIG